MARVLTTSAGLPCKQSERTDHQLQANFIQSLRARTYQALSSNHQNVNKVTRQGFQTATAESSGNSLGLTQASMLVHPTNSTTNRFSNNQDIRQDLTQTLGHYHQQKSLQQRQEMILNQKQKVVDLHSISLASLKQRLRPATVLVCAENATQNSSKSTTKSVSRSRSRSKGKTRNTGEMLIQSAIKSDTTLDVSLSTARKNSRLNSRSGSRNNNTRKKQRYRHQRSVSSNGESLVNEPDIVSSTHDQSSHQFYSVTDIPAAASAATTHHQVSRQMPARSYADQIVELHRIFKLKRIVRAWRDVKSNIDRFEDSFERVLALSGRKTATSMSSNLAKRTLKPQELKLTSNQSTMTKTVRMANGAQRKNKLTFCVKYTDFCKCERCETYREHMADIHPDGQTQLINSHKRNLICEAGQLDRKKDKNKGKVVPLKELYPDHKRI